MNKKFYLVLALLFLALVSQARIWEPDSLGDGIEYATVAMPDDYSGKVVSTVVRKLSPCASGRAVLYIHGFNDYFFQKEMADRFVDSCYNFYAVDLRKYGRSYQEGQLHCDARNINEYFPDIDSALSIIASSGVKQVVLMGHSTGGLVVASYMNDHPSPDIKAVILNSPFLEWNMSAFIKKVAIPMVCCLGKHFPGMKISQGDGTAYGESLNSQFHGEWSYNIDWKTIHPRKVTAGWIRCISEAQSALKNKSFITVPVLLMHSAKSLNASRWSPECHKADVVLNVKDISRIGRTLGLNVTEVTVPGGMHDLILSSLPVRNAVYDEIFSWLDKVLPD